MVYAMFESFFQESAMSKTSSKWFVYLCQASDDSLYCGISTDPERRIKQHNGIHQRRDGQGAKCLRGKRPVILVWQEPAVSRSRALERERGIKRLSRAEKLNLVQSNRG